MSRALTIVGTLAGGIGASAYYGLGQSWGGPAAVAGITTLSAGVAGQTFGETGPVRWAGLAVAATGLTVATSVTASAFGLRGTGPVSGPVNTALFGLFGATTAAFGATALFTKTMPTGPALALLFGGPLLTAGSWKERLGDVGFILTIIGFLLLGGLAGSSSQTSSG